jgi:hypothetical protein
MKRDIVKEIEEKQKEIENLKFQLAISELIKNIEVKQFDNSIVNLQYFIIEDAISLKRKVTITFNLNNHPFVISSNFDENNLMSHILHLFAENLFEQIFQQLQIKL